MKAIKIRDTARATNFTKAMKLVQQDEVHTRCMKCRRKHGKIRVNYAGLLTFQEYYCMQCSRKLFIDTKCGTC